MLCHWLIDLIIRIWSLPLEEMRRRGGEGGREEITDCGSLASQSKISDS
jgi:hypothetical protein